jgi:hypothetical protein
MAEVFKGKGMSNNELGIPISFGKTTSLVIEGRKTSVRKPWSERYARHFIKRYEQGLLVRAFDKDKRSGGSLVGWLRLTEKPYLELLLDMPDGDLVEEGFPRYTKEQFINKFFAGDSLQSVWVIKFEFKPLSISPPPPDKLDKQATTIDSFDIELIQNIHVREELTEQEQEDRLNLETHIDRAFYIAGTALGELKARRLYKNTHPTFEDYCRDRFGFTRDAAYLKIGAAAVYENIERILKARLSSQVRELEMSVPTNCRQNLLLPNSENQLRYIVKAKVEAERQVDIWQKAIDIAEGKIPTGRIVKQVVQQIKRKPKLPLPYQIGEVCQIIASDNPQLKGKGGCWCIVSELHDDSCTVNTWDSQYILQPENLKSCNYSEQECASMEDIGVRMSLLHSTGKLDEAAIWILNGLAKLNRAYLNSLEEKLLNLLEIEYGTKGKTA